MSASPEKSTTEWCAGLPLVQQRPLTLEERDDLRREVVRRRGRGIGIVALFLVLGTLFAFAAARTSPTAEAAQSVLTVGLILLLMVGLPATILLARDAFRQSKALSRDLKAGTVKRFAGPLPDVSHDRTLQQLRQRGLLSAGPGEDGALEVLSASGRIWRVHDRPVAGWLVTQTVEVAETPPFAHIAAQWLQPVRKEDGATLFAGARDLSAAECEELCRYARRLWLRLLPLALGLTLWLCMPITVLIVRGNLYSRLDWIRFVFLAAVTISCDVSFAASLLASRRLRRDERAGRVLIVRLEGDTPLETEANAEPPVEAGTIELLPVSRWVWTENGSPATWRKLRT